MLQQRTVPSTLSRGTWGKLEFEVARYGETRTILRILPPDITAEERGQSRMLRVWPPLGFAVAVVAALIGAGPLGWGGAIILAALLWLAPLVACWVAAQPLIVRIHEQWATSTAATDAASRELEAIGRRLADAEEFWRAGRITEAEFQREWRAAYDAIA
jgi:hypothetical protein